MNKESIIKFINRIHLEFSWRTLPDQVWDESFGEVADYYIREFRPVEPKCFNFTIYESEPYNFEGDALGIMTTEGFLYYLPSFMSLGLLDILRSNFLHFTILRKLRSHPPGAEKISNWVEHALEMDSFGGSLLKCSDMNLYHHIRHLREWFLLKVDLWQNECIFRMTEPERKIVVEYLDLTEKLITDELELIPDTAWFHSVRSILLNRSLSHRLGAKNEGEILDLIRLLEVAGQKYPSYFPVQTTQRLVEQLCAEIP